MALIAAAVYVPGIAVAADRPALLAGAAASNITPPIGLEIIGGFHPFPSKHIHDELNARCLVLDDGTNKIAIVICDLLGIGRDVCAEACRLIEAECGIPASNVLIAGTHTHSAAGALGKSRGLWERPELDEYQRFVVRRVADGVRRAIHQREPAQFAWAVVDKPEHVFNRRWFLKPGTMPVNPFGNADDQVKMNPGRGNANLVRPAGPTDPQVWCLYVRNREGRPISVLANYSLHYVGGVGEAHISADYFGAFARRVGELLDADRGDSPVVAMMSNGTSGDINNVDFRKPGERLPPYEKIRYVADDVARSVVAAMSSAKWRDHVTVAGVRRDPMIRSRRLSAEQIERARSVLAQPRDPNKPETLEQIYAQRVLDLNKWPERVPVPVQALRIGELGIGTMPCEIFAEIGLELKRRSPLQPYFTIELAHGYYGYLPTPAQHKLGGYETWPGTNRLEETASDKLTSELLEMLGELESSAVGVGR